MSYYQPRVYSTTKHLEKLGAEPAARYSDISKREYLPNEQYDDKDFKMQSYQVNVYNFDLEATPEKRRIFFALLLTMAMTQTLYLNISTFLPQYRKEHHPSIADWEVGVILSMFQLAYLLAAPFVGLKLGKIGRKNCIIIGYLLIILATVGFGLLAFFPDNSDSGFLALGLVFRFIQGAGDSFVSTAGYSIVTIEFPKKREGYIGYCQAAVGLGLMLGPVLGQLIYSAVQYEFTFYIFAGILTVALLIQVFFMNEFALIIVMFIIPGHLNDCKFDDSKNASITESIDQNGNKVVEFSPEGGQHKPITYMMFLRCPRAIIASVSSMFSMIFMLFFDSILSDHLKYDQKVNENSIGYFFALYVTCASFFIATLALLMFGPSKLLNFGENLAISTAGLGLLGVACSVIFVPLLSEIIEGVQEKEGLGESAELNDKAAGLFNTAYAIGCIIAPILGGALNESVGWESTCDIQLSYINIESKLNFIQCFL